MAGGMGMGRMITAGEPEKGKKMTKAENRAALKWIVHVAKPVIPQLIVIILGEALWAAFGTVTALFSREIVNAAVPGDKRDYDHMVLFIIIYAVVAMSLIGVNALMRYLTERCKAKLEISFRARLFAGMLDKSYPKLNAYHTGDLVNRLSGDVGVITDAATTIIPQVVMIGVRLIVAMTVMISMRPEFAFLFTGSGLFIMGVTRILKGRIQTYHKEMQAADGRMRSFWQEIFENLTVIKAFAGEENASERSDRLMDDHFTYRMKRQMIGTASMLVTGLIVRGGHLFAIGYSAFCMFHGTMDVGTMTALTQLVGQVQQPFVNMTGVLPRYYAALASASRLMEIEALDRDSTDGKRADREKTYEIMQSLTLEHVNFSYDRENPVLVDSSCIIEKGDFISITGMSGIGKSTLFKVLLDMYPHDGGTAELVTSEGRAPLSGLTRPLFAYVPQGNMLFSGTIRENLLFFAPKDTSDGTIARALETACAKDFIDELTDGVDTVIGENGVGLSEGQIQRLSVARAVLSGAPVLLLDEATSALDEPTEAKMLANLKALQNRTCIIVTHKRAALAICNRHFIIRDKHILEADPAAVESV